MGIRLDWQVESEQTQVRATEDPEARRQRHRARRRLLLIVLAIGAVVALLIAAVIWRLEAVDSHYRQDLLDTVEIEVTALRLGDFPGYIAIQRSTDPNFALEQSREFEAYQQLKQAHRVELTGEVLDVTIDDLRGRVVLEEVIDGVPYKVVWFYWYYEDGGERDQAGWRRVPDDLAYFWGEEQAIERDGVRVTYRDLDEQMAQALADRAEGWWRRGCEIARCAAPPPDLHIDIVAARPPAIEWSASDPWTLTVTSPLIDRARADVPIPPDMERAIARQIAARLVRYVAGNAAPVAHSDAAWLHTELGNWLGATLLAGEGALVSDSSFVGTIINQYGPDAPVTMIAALGPGAVLNDVVAAVTGVSLPLLSTDQLGDLNWRGFFQWRLDLESRLLAQPDSGGTFLSLYDLETQSAANEAALRIEDPAYAARPVPQVGTVAITRDENSQTYAYVETVRVENGVEVAETIFWRLAGGTWKRAS